MRLLATVIVSALVVTLAGCARATPNRYETRSPTMTFSASTCPRALGGIEDVARASSPSDSLVAPEPDPDAALVCTYRGPFGSEPSDDRALDSAHQLGAAAATRLASAVAQVSVAMPPSGPVSCANDTGVVTVITFAYRRLAPVSLWWNATGCQTLDNGVLEGSILGSDSFGHFQTVFAHVLRADG